MPYSKKAKYYHHRQNNTRKYRKSTFKIVPLNHTHYNGKKFKKYNKSRTLARAIVGTLKTGKKGSIQSILIPKQKRMKQTKIPVKMTVKKRKLNKIPKTRQSSIKSY